MDEDTFQEVLNERYFYSTSTMLLLNIITTLISTLLLLYTL